MSDRLLVSESKTHVIEMLVNKYFESHDLLEDDYLSGWMALRQRFPTLCGDPPPQRWFPQVLGWIHGVASEDPTFSPVCFRFSTAVIDSDFKYGRGPAWDRTLRQLAARIMPMRFTSATPPQVVDKYRDFVLHLLLEMAPQLTLSTLRGDCGADGSREPSEE